MSIDFLFCLVLGGCFAYAIAMIAFVTTFGLTTKAQDRYINIAVIIAFVAGFLFGLIYQLVK